MASVGTLTQLRAAPDVLGLRSLLETWKVTHVIGPISRTELDSFGPVLGALLERCGEREFESGGVVLARIAPECRTEPSSAGGVGRAAALRGAGGTL